MELYHYKTKNGEEFVDGLKNPRTLESFSPDTLDFYGAEP